MTLIEILYNVNVASMVVGLCLCALAVNPLSKACVEIAKSNTEKKLTKAGLFFMGAIPSSSLMQKKHKLLINFYFFATVFVSIFILTQQIGAITIFICTGVYGFLLIMHIVIMSIAIKLYRKSRQKAEKIDRDKNEKNEEF